MKCYRSSKIENTNIKVDIAIIEQYTTKTEYLDVYFLILYALWKQNLFIFEVVNVLEINSNTKLNR